MGKRSPSKNEHPVRSDPAIKIAIIGVVGTVLTALITAVVGPSVIALFQSPAPREGQAPVILDVKLREENTATGLTIVQDVSFSDVDGDAYYVHQTVVSSTRGNVTATSGPIDINISREQQKLGAVTTGIWKCEPHVSNTIVLRVMIQDKSDHYSHPKEYKIHCP